MPPQPWIGIRAVTVKRLNVSQYQHPFSKWLRDRNVKIRAQPRILKCDLYIAIAIALSALKINSQMTTRLTV